MATNRPQARKRKKRHTAAKDRPLTPKPLTKAPITFREQLGLGIQQHRLAKGYTQQRLADMTGTSLKYVGEVERSEANPTLRMVEKLLTALGWNPITQPLELTIANQIGAMFVGTPESVRRQLIGLAQSIPVDKPPVPAPPPPPSRSDARGIRATARR